jgi:hypothetical protein
VTAGYLNRFATVRDLYSRAFAEPTVERVFSRIAAGCESQDSLIFKSIDMIPMLEAYNAPPG